MEKKCLIQYLDQGLSTRDISKLTGYSRSNVSYWINKYGLCNKSKYKKLGKIKFGKIDTKEKAYILGFILADGHIDEKSGVNIRISIKDSEILEFIAKHTYSRVMYHYKTDVEKRIFPQATLSKTIPDILKYSGGRLKADRTCPVLDEYLEPFMIQGIFDGDGCITWGRRKDRNRIWQKVTFKSQYGILEGVKRYLDRINIYAEIYPVNNENCFCLEFASKENVLKFYDYLYTDETFVVLKRKYYNYNALRLELSENGENDLFHNTVPIY